MNFIHSFLFYVLFFSFLQASIHAHLHSDIKSIKEIESDKCEIYKNLSVAYYNEQDLENAFKYFLMALQCVPENNQIVDRLYPDGKEALNDYLNRHGRHPDIVAKEIIEKYAGRLDGKKEDFLLAFVVALAKANLHEYLDFFELFYQAYVRSPEHYLKHKTKAVLNIKLYDRARTVEEKEVFRKEIVKHLKKALELELSDTNLYQLMIIFSSKEDKGSIFELLLNKIIENNILIPRVDLSFFVKEAIQLKKLELASRFIEKASEWYPVSRIIEDQKSLIQGKSSKTKGNLWKLE